MKLVVDSSVALKWFVDEPRRDIARLLIASSHELVAPDLLVAEVANALWRKVRRGELEMPQLRSAMMDLPGFLLLQPWTQESVLSSLDLAQELEHSVYDCVFLALALQSPGTRLVTDDEKFFTKAVRAGFERHLIRLEGVSPTGWDQFS